MTQPVYHNFKKASDIFMQTFSTLLLSDKDVEYIYVYRIWLKISLNYLCIYEQINHKRWTCKRLSRYWSISLRANCYKDYHLDNILFFVLSLYFPCTESIPSRRWIVNCLELWNVRLGCLSDIILVLTQMHVCGDSNLSCPAC